MQVGVDVEITVLEMYDDVLVKTWLMVVVLLMYFVWYSTWGIAVEMV